MLDDTRIYDLYVASRGSALLVAANHLGVFAALAEERLGSAQLAARFGLSGRGVHALTSGLASMDLLEGGPEGWGLSPEADAFLVPQRRESLSGLLTLDLDGFPTPQKVIDAMRSGKQTVYGEAETWETHSEDPEQAKRFTLAMHSISARPAAALAAAVDLKGYQQLIDVGGGSGIYGQELLRVNPDLKVTVVDIEPVCEVAEQLYAEAGLSERASTAALNMWRDPWPEGDVVLFSQILHDWDGPRCLELLTKAHQTLVSGGRVLISEKLVDDLHRSPRANALVSTDMLLWTEGRQYTASELTAMLESAGFEDIRVRPTIGYWSVLEARRP